MIEPVKVNSWPIGYCDNGFAHEGEHPLYTSSDGGCINFVTSERLLEIKQLFDLTTENEVLTSELEDFYTSTLPLISKKIDFDGWILDENDGDINCWYSAKGGNLTHPIYFRIRKHAKSYYLLEKAEVMGRGFASLEDAQKFTEIR